MTAPKVTSGYCIILYYESQGKSTSIRGYKMSLPESNRSADLICRSAAFPCQHRENLRPTNQVRATVAE